MYNKLYHEYLLFYLYAHHTIVILPLSSLCTVINSTSFIFTYVFFDVSLVI